MRFVVALLLVAVAGLGLAQPFTDQDRFGKTNAQVATMPHQEWVNWFCDASRGGPNGRIQAEKIYGIALYQDNKTRLSSRSEAERKFYDDLWIKLANVAKYALTIGHSLEPDHEGLSLMAAESGTQINQLISNMISARPATTKVSFTQVKAAFEVGKKKIEAAKLDESRTKYVRDHYPAMGKMFEQVEKEFKSRSKTDQAHMSLFLLQMMRMATLSDVVG